MTPWSEHEKLSYEKELLGFYVSGHPLDAYAAVFAAKNYPAIASLKECSDRAQIKIAGAIAQLEKKFTRKEGKPFAVVWIEDLTGTIEVVIWNDVYRSVSDLLATGRVVEIRGTLDTRGDSLRATAQHVKLLGTKSANGAATVREEPGGSGANRRFSCNFPPAPPATNSARCASCWRVLRGLGRCSCYSIGPMETRFGSRPVSIAG